MVSAALPSPPLQATVVSRQSVYLSSQVSSGRRCYLAVSLGLRRQNDLFRFSLPRIQMFDHEVCITCSGRRIVVGPLQADRQSD